jgi:hypothetical protein
MSTCLCMQLQLHVFVCFHGFYVCVFHSFCLFHLLIQAHCFKWSQFHMVAVSNDHSFKWSQFSCGRSFTWSQIHVWFDSLLSDVFFAQGLHSMYLPAEQD